jgi:hypothetical protein
MHFPTLVHARAGVLSPLVCNNGLFCSVRLVRFVAYRKRLNQVLRRFLVFARSVRSRLAAAMLEQRKYAVSVPVPINQTLGDDDT